jgi:hypothetical protein
LTEYYNSKHLLYLFIITYTVAEQLTKRYDNNVAIAAPVIPALGISQQFPKKFRTKAAKPKQKRRKYLFIARNISVFGEKT